MVNRFGRLLPNPAFEHDPEIRPARIAPAPLVILVAGSLQRGRAGIHLAACRTLTGPGNLITKSYGLLTPPVLVSTRPRGPNP